MVGSRRAPSTTPLGQVQVVDPSGVLGSDHAARGIAE